MTTLTADEVEMLDVYATNRTSMTVVDGVDYDFWQYFPSRGVPGDEFFEPGYFTDGHSQPAEGGIRRGPHDGWVVDTKIVIMPVETMITIVRELKELQTASNKIKNWKTKPARDEASREVQWRFNKVMERFFRIR